MLIPQEQQKMNLQRNGPKEQNKLKAGAIYALGEHFAILQTCFSDRKNTICKTINHLAIMK